MDVGRGIKGVLSARALGDIEAGETLCAGAKRFAQEMAMAFLPVSTFRSRPEARVFRCGRPNVQRVCAGGCGWGLVGLEGRDD